jgi:hypothetical protein
MADADVHGGVCAEDGGRRVVQAGLRIGSAARHAGDPRTAVAVVTWSQQPACSAAAVAQAIVGRRPMRRMRRRAMRALPPRVGIAASRMP